MTSFYKLLSYRMAASSDSTPDFRTETCFTSTVFCQHLRKNRSWRVHEWHNDDVMVTSREHSTFVKNVIKNFIKINWINLNLFFVKPHLRFMKFFQNVWNKNRWYSEESTDQIRLNQDWTKIEKPRTGLDQDQDNLKTSDSTQEILRFSNRTAGSWIPAYRKKYNVD